MTGVSKLVPMSMAPLGVYQPSETYSGGHSGFPPSAKRTPAAEEFFKCFCKRSHLAGGGVDNHHRPSMKGHSNTEKKKILLEVKAATILTSEPKTTAKGGGADLVLLLTYIKSVLLHQLNAVIRRRKPPRFPLQTLVEKAILDCRFFTLLAVAGSLIGSLLCFVDGSFLIMESYFRYFHVISQGSKEGHIVHLLMEAIDMFLVATAMLVFGIGLHVSFVGSYPIHKVAQTPPQSRYLKNVLNSWGGMRSIMQTKSKIGQAVVMLLQVGVLEKFSSVPLVTGLDLACFAAALFLSSASVFLFSKLTTNTSTTK